MSFWYHSSSSSAYLSSSGVKGSRRNFSIASFQLFCFSGQRCAAILKSASLIFPSGQETLHQEFPNCCCGHKLHCDNILFVTGLLQVWSTSFGRLYYPVGGRVKLHIVLSSLKIKLLSKLLDFPYTPGEGYKLFHSGLVSLASLSCLSTEGSLSVVGRLARLWMESNTSLKSTAPPHIRSRVKRWKLDFCFVDRYAPSASERDAMNTNTSSSTVGYHSLRYNFCDTNKFGTWLRTFSPWTSVLCDLQFEITCTWKQIFAKQGSQTAP